MQRRFPWVIASLAILPGCAAFTAWDGYSSGDLAKDRDGGTDAPGLSDTKPEVDANPAPDAGTPITFVQVNSSTTAATLSTGSAPFLQAQVAGDLNVVAIGWYDQTVDVATVTDTRGNVYRKAIGPTRFGTTEPVASSIYYASGIVAAAANANVVNVTFNAPADSPDIRIMEYSGLDPANPLGPTSMGTGNSAGPATTTTLTTTRARALLFSAGSTQGDYVSPGPDFVVRRITTETSIVQDRIVDQPGVYATSAAMDPVIEEWVLQLVAFH